MRRTVGQIPLTDATLLTTIQAARMLHVRQATIINWVRRGWLEATRTLGGHHRITAAALLASIKARNYSVPEELRSLERARILFVDDDQREHRLLKRALRPYSERVELRTVDNGIDGLVMVGLFRPTLVVLDVIMPGVDGIESCRRLRANPSTKDIQILIVSAHLTAEVEKEALEAGAHRCQHKPIKAEVILEMLGLSKLVQAELGP